MVTPVANSKEINELLARYGVKFGIYKNGSFHEQLFPFDAIPRMITAADFAEIEKGLIQRVNALNIYYFVPKMIEYYLGEKAILKNAPTYLPFYEDDRKYVLDNLGKLVIKDVSEAGGYGVVFGSDMTGEELENWKKLITEQSRRFIAHRLYRPAYRGRAGKYHHAQGGSEGVRAFGRDHKGMVQRTDKVLAEHRFVCGELITGRRL